MTIKLPSKKTLARWDTLILGAIPAAFIPRYPVIAGGAVRDTLLGKRVADIDVFHEQRLSTGKLIVVQEEVYPSESFIEVRELPNYGSDVQFILVNDIQKRLDNFSVNISECMYDLHEGIALSNRFLQGVLSKTLRFRPWASEQYIAKISKKYKGWKVEIEK